MKKVLLLSFLSVFLVACFGRGVEQPIPSELKSAKEIEKLVEPIVHERMGTNFHLGSVQMVMDGEHRGEVRVTYAEEEFEGDPKVATIRVDTAQHKLLEMSVGEAKVLYPGIMEVDQWKIDSPEAFEIAKKAFGYPVDFKPDRLSLSSFNDYPDPKKHVWMISFQNLEKGVYHRCLVDLHTGEVSRMETNKLGEVKITP